MATPQTDDPEATLPVKPPPAPAPEATLVFGNPPPPASDPRIGGLKPPLRASPAAAGGANPDATVPHRFGHEIARGGMGSILEAEDCKLPRTVAVKIILSEINADEEQKRRFVNEAAVLAKLAHPNIVPVYDLARDGDGHVYYSMKLVKGRTLKAILTDVRAEIPEALRHYTLDRLLTIYRKVCDALAFAHSRGIIHRDLKPENIMVGEFGEVLVMDWGLAKELSTPQQVPTISSGPAAAVHFTGARAKTLDKETGRLGEEETPDAALSPSPSLQVSKSGLTLEGSVMGTPQYMSPEQAAGRTAEMDARSDIFSLGGILYCLLTLRPPVEGGTLEEVLKRVIAADIVSPSTFGASTGNGAPVAKGEVLEAKKIRPLPHCPGGRVPPALSAVAMQALALDKAKRYQNVISLSADIEAYQTGFATSAEHAGAWKQLTLLVKRNKAASIGVAAVLLVGGVLGTKAIIEGRRAEREAVRANGEAARAQRGEALAQSEAVRAEREAAAAKATLAELRRTAPVFYAQAKVVFDEGDFEQAIEKIGYAIALDGDNADYHLFLANLRESSQDLDAAAEAYRRVLALRPADAAAQTNLALCEKLLQESGAAPLGRSQQSQLLAALRVQKRLVEAAPLAALIDPDIAIARAAIMARLSEARKHPLWPNPNNRVSALPDGTFKVNLSNITLRDYSVLKGQPVTVLDLVSSGIVDLSGLSGLPLKELNLTSTRATDLSPLRGMPLESLDLGHSPATDLSPLRAMKLSKLVLSHTGISDLSPLAGMPLTLLNCFTCKQVSDLSPLRGAPLVDLSLGAAGVISLAPLAGAPLKRLNLGGTKVADLTPLAQCVDLEELILNHTSVTDLTPLAKLHLTWLDCGDTKITNIGPLRGQPLRILLLTRTGVTDLSPLADCTMLEELLLPKEAGYLSMLRKLPRLRLISTRTGAIPGGPAHPAQTAEEFWKEYDAQKPK